MNKRKPKTFVNAFALGKKTLSIRKSARFVYALSNTRDIFDQYISLLIECMSEKLLTVQSLSSIFGYFHFSFVAGKYY